MTVTRRSSLSGGTPIRSALFIVLFAVPGLVVGVGAGAIAWRAGFDGLYGQDPYAYYAYAVGPLRESLARAQWLPPLYWPPGYPLLIAAVVGFTGPTPLAGQIVSLLAGASVPMLTAWLCWELMLTSPELTIVARGLTLRKRNAVATMPILAGFVAGFSAQLWPWSILVMSDTAALAAVTFGAASLARYVRTGRGIWLSCAAGGVAGAVLTRWAAALVAIPCTACALAALAQRRPSVAWRHGAAAGLIAVVILTPVLGPAFAHVTGTAAPGTPFIGDLQGLGWHPQIPFRREWADMDGFLRFRLPNGLYYASAPARWFFFTPLLAPFILLGCIVVLRSRDTALLILLVVWPAIVFAFIAGIRQQNPRLALPYLPPLAVLLAIGFADMWRRAPGRFRLALGMVLLAGLGWMAINDVRLTQSFVDRKADHLSALKWTEQQVPADARLLTFGVSGTFSYYSRLEILDLFALNAGDLSRLVADARPTFLLLDVPQVEAQWRGRSPFENYQWLRDGPGLTVVGQRGSLTLFRVLPRQAARLHRSAGVDVSPTLVPASNQNRP